MAHYNFKKITVVPSAKDFIDIVLSKTQRKTPTVVHKHYKISRIRQFYTRKIKYTQQNYHDKLATILTEFPKLDDIHPFYADLMNVLYDRDHYKLALGQLNIAKHLIDNVAKDYVRLTKFADSLYRCKQLKRAALGRMCTIMKQQKQNLEYLEQIRQHLSRLPSIDPNTRTLLICGFPNVGKSSFMNKITRADVEVQPYAFTTKSLFVGHMDYRYLRWQVVDTPGILDHPLEERNTIEMQAITALAHLRAAVIYVMDLSGQCGHGIEEQIQLFENIRPLFSQKPLLIALNKTDIITLDELSVEEREPIEKLSGEGLRVLSMSTVQEGGVMEVRNAACDALLSQRIEHKLKSKKMPDVLNRLHLAVPAPRDGKERPAHIPPGAKSHKKSQLMEIDDDDDGMGVVSDLAPPTRKLERDIELEQGDDYLLDLKKRYLLPNKEEKYDVIPEIYEGKNISDFIDPEILERLEKLEREEELRVAAGEYESEPEDEETLRTRNLAQKIRRKREFLHKINISKRVRNHPIMPRTSRPLQRIKDPAVNNSAMETGEGPLVETMEEDSGRGVTRGKKRMREASRSAPPHASRSVSRAQSGVRPSEVENVAKKMKRAQKYLNKKSRKGEADRKIVTKMPKHLFAGKRKSGKTSRR
ncbi:PREDICTED: nucleolar GTP-binding protein 1-like [Amphimedon queenslandica]|uniref:Nucleolar GTP-binding protein 1 n=1 Tax=Amphimedon queenslandica TaxID=400682 RepID=A0A1X7VF70_AMPQE|nr:PREDICTED: nucleolar GTP-binding protein 1-like [Amphimedon queenslandica]|eukprot:XP_003384727.1 PREDICTED: nucleolar GTP-binding protein 1-like [Amphimedon queenslandica]